MSISLVTSQIKRLESEIDSLRRKMQKETQNEADALNNISKSTKKLNNSKTSASLNSAIRDFDNANRKLNRSQEEKAYLSKSLAKKERMLNDKRDRLMTLHYKHMREDIDEIESFYTDKEAEIQRKIDHSKQKPFDVFISHATDDKDDFVTKLTEGLKDEGIRLWYDSDEIGWGQSIRQRIDRGLTNSRFFIVVLSTSYINSHWTNYELDGILQRVAGSGENILLPIWHNISKDEIDAFSLTLSDKFALNTDQHDVEEMIGALVSLIKHNSVNA
ncbi:toll/interleukin-1 receptor domain-containing protein [Salinicoccus carnicancri]|uniref:toll/interleukin-1 receptor domain-containing protein n=1 Tax=Salinicoccus carnicancri TaxID=558170 RepID=UPI00031896BE|nr:TIR domain-containing protein [Salinicoccus carnicancri]